jgi:hypothetical protein
MMTLGLQRTPCFTPITDSLSRLLGQAETDSDRRRIMVILASLRGPEVVGSIVTQMAQPSDDIHARDCVALIAGSKYPAQTVALSRILSTANSPEILAAAADGLANIGSAEASAVLIEKASSTSPATAPSREAIATISSSYAQQTLIHAATDPTVQPEVQCAVIEALALQGGERVETILVNLQQSVTNPVVQGVILEIIASPVETASPSVSTSDVESRTDLRVEEPF